MPPLWPALLAPHSCSPSLPGTGSPAAAKAHAGPAHALPSWALAQPLLHGHSIVPTTPQPRGTTAHGPRHRLAPSAPWAQPHMTLGTALSIPCCPVSTVLRNPGHGTPCPLLPHGHSPSLSAPCPHPTGAACSIPQADQHLHHLPRRSSALFTSAPGAQVPGGPLPIPQAQPVPQIQPAHLPTPGHSAHHGPAPAGRAGCPWAWTQPPWGARPPWGAHGRGTASTISPAALSSHPPARRAVGLGGLWGGCLWLSPPRALCPGAPSYLHGKKEERFGVR